MKHLRLVALFSFLFWFQSVVAQQQYTFQFRNDVKIVIDSDTLKNAWAGGINSAVLSKIDLNGDATEDLFIFDRTHSKIYTFLAKEYNSGWQWQYASQFELLFPADLNSWVLLRDYNQDGLKDIFTKTSQGIKVYKNTTTAGGSLSFELAKEFIRFNNNANLQVSGDNLPALQDMDNDGDLDILTFDFSGSTAIEYYRNQQMEENLSGEILKFTLETSKWGNVSRCQHVCNGYVFNGNCRTAGTNHNDGVSLLAIDLDGDLDKDILVSSDACPDLARIINSGNPTVAAMTSADLQVAFPNNTTRASLNYHPVAYYEDVDFDNKPDLFVSPFVRSNTNDEINFSQSGWFYKNTSNTNVPAFNFQRPDFLQKDMVDVGEQSAPALADVDADGDLDLLVGSGTGTIWFFRNKGTASKAVFERESFNYLNLSSLNIRNIRPQFTDINSDGTLDLVLAGTSGSAGTIKYVLNTGAAGSPFKFDLSAVKTLSVGTGVGDNPAFYDIDADGDKDLILASNIYPTEKSGALRYYRNTGTPANPVFTLANEAWGNIAADFNRRNVFPLIMDLNQDNNPELLLADETGEIRIYSDFLQNTSSTFTYASDILMNPGSNAYQASKLGGGLTLAAADLDGDRKPEIISGSQGGGLHLFNQQVRGALGNKEPVEAILKSVVYPNPATNEITVESAKKVTVSIYNITGQLVLPATGQYLLTQKINTDTLQPGLYVVQLETQEHTRIGYKLIIQK
ncbi:T9SS type A sorting domain-containing protein [Adhaeribacter aquaticus]|uniref:T9SS type A sorting domain-containing protein n=1 Tax=Adhaeribacter aquaticus TaxID=299567 RepID=UPI00146F9ABB|nr:T9SS type A sorting domain-containing protein [Adhaeribacter aquaticus]